MAEATSTHSSFGRLYRSVVVGVPYLWLGVFFLLPFLIVLKISLSETAIAQPPYVPVFVFDSFAGFMQAFRQLDFGSYAWILDDPLYLNSYLSSLRIAAISTALALLLGYPFAYGMAKAPPSIRPILVMLTILPFWTSFLIRVYAWIGILKNEGLLNQFLMWTGLISAPLQILNTEIAIHIGIVYSYLPFMVLPVYAALERLDSRLVEAAQDLGAPPWRAFWTVTVPLSASGIVAGCLLCFIPIVGEFVVPD
ncbi:MAG: ABC transporter permease subunit, partial [Rhizobiaceae bacterium]|nr:ABC transporter permease subunit [Rhizobiaceae bacterium]